MLPETNWLYCSMYCTSHREFNIALKRLSSCLTTAVGRSRSPEAAAARRWQRCCCGWHLLRDYCAAEPPWKGGCCCFDCRLPKSIDRLRIKWLCSAVCGQFCGWYRSSLARWSWLCGRLMSTHMRRLSNKVLPTRISAFPLLSTRCWTTAVVSASPCEYAAVCDRSIALVEWPLINHHTV